MASTDESVTDSLRDDILGAVFSPGDRLVELQLTDRYGCGRATIRSALVALEADLGWMHVAGVDPLVYFDRFPGRFPVCHVKDVLADGSFADPGRGTVDFQRTFDAAEHAGLRHYFVEHDSAADPMASAAAGYAYLSTLRAR